MAEYTVEQISEENIIPEPGSNVRSTVSGNNIYYISNSVLFHFHARTRETTQLTNDNEIVRDIRFAYEENEEIVVASLEIEDPEEEISAEAFFDGTQRIAFSENVLTSLAESNGYFVWQKSISAPGVIGRTTQLYNSNDGSIVTIAGEETADENGNYNFVTGNLSIFENTVVWEGDFINSNDINNQNFGNGIFLYDGNAISRLSGDFGVDDLVSDDNNFAWIRTIGIFNEERELFDQFKPSVEFFDGSSISSIWEPTLESNSIIDTNEGLQISGNKVTWSISEENESGEINRFKIFLFDGSQTRTIYDSDNPIENLAISGNLVVWENFDGSLAVYDGEQTVNFNFNQTENLFENITFEYGYEIENNSIAVLTFDSNGITQLYYYEPSGEIQQITNYEQESEFQAGLNIFKTGIINNGVIYTANDERGEQQLYFYDKNSNNTSQLTNYDEVFALDILEFTEDGIIWRIGDRTTEDELFYYDGNSIVQLTLEGTSYNTFSIDNDYKIFEDKIVFVADDAGTLGQGQLYIYDGEATTQLTNIENETSNEIFNFDILNRSVIWTANDDGGNGFSDPLRNAEIFQATLVEDNPPNTVYRFLNQDTGVHFYTANIEERNLIQDELDNFNYEGGSYIGVDPLTGNPEPVPVYRFLNQNTGVHLYTIDENERNVVDDLDNFSFEGEAFFAYENEVDGSIPIYRFYNNISEAHFYTPSAAERDNVEANLPDFQSEGIAYYALPFTE